MYYIYTDGTYYATVNNLWGTCLVAFNSVKYFYVILSPYVAESITNVY